MLPEQSAWLLAMETLDGIAVTDPDTGEVLNEEVYTITREDAEAAVAKAHAAWAAAVAREAS